MSSGRRSLADLGAPVRESETDRGNKYAESQVRTHHQCRVPEHRNAEGDPQPVRVEAEVLADRLADAEDGVVAEHEVGRLDGHLVLVLHLPCEAAVPPDAIQ